MSTAAVAIDTHHSHPALPARPRSARVTTITLFCFGAALCFPYLYSGFGLLPIVLMSVAWMLASAMTRRARWRLLRWVAGAFSAALYALSAYTVVVFTMVLGWSLAPWTIVLISFIGLAAVLTARPAWRGVRVPVVLPLGLTISIVLSGYWREGGRVRCDDYLRASRQAGVEVIVPSLRELADCRPGAMLPIGRYPRQIWESADQQTIVFTTQAERYSAATRNGLRGAVCRVRPGQRGVPRCGGVGKGDGIVEIAAHDRLVALSSGGEGGGRLYVLPLDRLFSKATLMHVRRAGSAIYDSTLDVLYVFGEDGQMLLPMRGEDMKPSEEVPIVPLVLSDYGHYDETRHEGIFCGGAGFLEPLTGGPRPYLAVGFRGLPAALRPLDESLLGWLSFSFGCDWDPAARRVYVAIPNLGAVADVDYDSGRLLALRPADVGLRYLRFEPRRRRIYAGDFLRGTVVELDADDKRELRHWFAGRFVRDVRPTRDGSALLVASNLGVVEIRL